ncbi:hypothetical protein, partial [Priestia flexa]
MGLPPVFETGVKTPFKHAAPPGTIHVSIKGGVSMQHKKYSLYKNGVYLHDFDTMTECSKWLENIIGGSLYQGLSRIRDGKWIPDERSQLFGYEVKTNETEES